MQSEGYAVSPRKRKPIEQGLGWAKIVGRMRQVKERGAQVAYSQPMETKPPAPTIRPASVADVNAMFNVRASVGENTMTTEELSAIGVTPESIALAVSSSPCSWVATADEEIVGFAIVDLDSACLFALFVLPQHEGRGIGTRLAHACEQALFERHAVAWLETAKASRAARLYRYLGWGDEVEMGGGDIRLEKRRE